MLHWLVLLALQGSEPAELAPGSVVRSAIQAGDSAVAAPLLSKSPKAKDPRAKSFTLKVEDPGPWRIELSSYLFDAYLVLRDADGSVLAEDDNGLMRNHARISVERLEPGRVYRVDACSPSGRLGAFVLALAHGPAPELAPRARREWMIADARARLDAVTALDPPDRELTCAALLDVGNQLFAAGQYVESEKHLRDCAALREELSGPDALETAHALHCLGAVLQQRGKYRETLPIYERAYSLRLEQLGPRDRLTAQSQHKIGCTLMQQGRFALARVPLEESLAVREELRARATSGTNAHDLLLSLFILGDLYVQQRDLARARELFERALEVCEHEAGVQKPDTAKALAELGFVLAATGERSRARELFERALAIDEHELPEGHINVGQVLQYLAELDHAEGSFVAARAHYQRALAIRRAALGPAHPSTAESLMGLAALQHDEGELESARELATQGAALWREALGAEHPWTANAANELAEIAFDLGRREEARQLATHSIAASEHHFAEIFGALSEWERLTYIGELRSALDLLLGLGRPPAEAAGAEADVYSALLRWKGRVSRGLLESRRRLASAGTAEERRLLASLELVQSELSNLIFDESQLDRDTRAAELERLRAERNALEVALARKLGPAADAKEPSFAEIVTALPTNAVALDFFVHRRYSPGVSEGEGSARRGSWGEPELTAWVVRPGAPAPVRVELGPAAPIESAAASFLEALASARGEPVVVGSPLPERNRELRKLLWEPLAPHATGAELAIVAPDGFLGALPFGVLFQDDGTFLLEERGFVYVQSLGALRDLAAPARELDGGLLAVGGVDYDATPEVREASAGEQETTRGGFQETWAPLRFTGREASTVAHLYQLATGVDAVVRVLTEGDATEAALKANVPSAAWLHVATHGFFEPRGLASMWESNARNAAGSLRMRAEEQRVIAQLPGLMSGLVCAGANARSSGGVDNGLLTAEEMSWLDLSRCELVVLSACQTGLGTAKGGEGMLGLRRALRQAGARTVISSLWSIDDETTSDLMNSFYRKLWVEKRPAGEALRAAQLALLKKNRIHHDGRALAASWGAFVLDGDWR